MNAAPALTSNRYVPTENYYLTHAELRAEELVLSCLDAGNYRIGICYADWAMSRCIQNTCRNTAEDRSVRWVEIGRAIDRLRQAKRRFLFDHYRDHLPWLLICRRCHIDPLRWFEFKRGILMLLARWLRL